MAATRVTTAARFEALEAQGAVEFVPHPGGNITINVDPQSHVRELGAYFMRRANAGQANALDTGITESRYRLWMFNGCTTRDYVRSVRRNPAARLARPRHGGHRPGDVPGLLRRGDPVVPGRRDGDRSRRAALDERMEDATPFESGTHSASGFEDNPSR